MVTNLAEPHQAAQALELRQSVYPDEADKICDDGKDASDEEPAL
jgi:hypothetical protein